MLSRSTLRAIYSDTHLSFQSREGLCFSVLSPCWSHLISLPFIPSSGLGTTTCLPLKSTFHTQSSVLPAPKEPLLDTLACSARTISAKACRFPHELNLWSSSCTLLNATFPVDMLLQRRNGLCALETSNFLTSQSFLPSIHAVAAPRQILLERTAALLCSFHFHDQAVRNSLCPKTSLSPSCIGVCSVVMKHGQQLRTAVALPGRHGKIQGDNQFSVNLCKHRLQWQSQCRGFHSLASCLPSCSRCPQLPLSQSLHPSWNDLSLMTYGRHFATQFCILFKACVHPSHSHAYAALCLPSKALHTLSCCIKFRDVARSTEKYCCLHSWSSPSDIIVEAKKNQSNHISPNFSPCNDPIAKSMIGFQRLAQNKCEWLAHRLLSFRWFLVKLSDHDRSLYVSIKNIATLWVFV